MKIVLTVETVPHSFDIEDEISNALQDNRLREDLEVAVENAIEEIMRWKGDIRASVKAKV